MSRKIEFSYSGGFPVDEVTLEKMQLMSIEYFESIIAYIGIPNIGNYILSGVEVTGTDISDGWVYMDGDIIRFNALTATTGLTTKFKKQTLGESLSFENAISHPVYITTTIIQDPTGVELSTFIRVNGIPTVPSNVVLDPADLTTTPPQKTVLERIVELEKKTSIFVSNGVVFPWRQDRSLIPSGFQEVIDLRGKTVFGMDVTLNSDGTYVNPEFAPLTSGQFNPGRDGGKKGHKMTISNLIEHEHGLTQIKNNSNGGGNNGFYDQAQGAATNLKTDKTGSTDPVAIPTLPPFKTVIFIEYIG